MNAISTNKTEGTPGSGPESPRRSFGELASDALRFWEPRRWFYNAALLAVVVIHYAAGWPGTRTFLTRDILFSFFGLAVLANLAYCAAYGVDLFVQFSGLRGVWARWRWYVLATGTAFGAIIAHFITMAILGESPR